jgi:hypothetical protein
MRERAYGEGVPLSIWIRMACLSELAQPKRKNERQGVRESLSRVQQGRVDYEVARLRAERQVSEQNALI